jgi:hypothetical protein
MKMSDEGTIEARALFYHPDAHKLGKLVSECMRRFKVEADVSEDLISGWQTLPGHEREVRALTMRAAKILGYRGIHVRQGASDENALFPSGSRIEVVKWPAL